MKSNEIEAVLENILNKCTEINLPYIQGEIQSEVHSTVTCDFKDPSDILKFLQIVKSSNATCLIYKIDHLTNDEIKSGLISLEKNKLKTINEKDELRKELKENQLSYINLMFMSSNNNAIFSMEIFTEVHTFICETNEEDPVSEDANTLELDYDYYEPDELEEDEHYSQETNEIQNAIYEKERSDRHELISHYAYFLARHEMFPRITKNNSNMILLLDRMIQEMKEKEPGPILGHHLKRRICSSAKAIFEMDIWPEVEKDLRKKAQEALNNGMKKNAIAGELGLTLAKLNRILR